MAEETQPRVQVGDTFEKDSLLAIKISQKLGILKPETQRTSQICRHQQTPIQC